MIADGETNVSKDQAIMMLLADLEKGRKSIDRGDLIPEEDVAKEFGVKIRSFRKMMDTEDM